MGERKYGNREWILEREASSWKVNGEEREKRGIEEGEYA